MNSHSNLMTSSSYKEICERLEKLSTSTICNANNDVRLMDKEIKSINKNSCIGPAYTVQSNQSSVATIAAESDDMTKFLLSINWDTNDFLPILIIASCGAPHALAGEICITAAKNNSIGGVITDGFYRDKDKVKESKFPLFAKGTCAKPGPKVGGKIKEQIQCGGVTVNPGDIIFADRDGIVVMNKEEALFAIEKGEEIERKEQIVLEKLRKGVKLNEIYDIDEKENNSPVFKRK